MNSDGCWERVNELLADALEKPADQRDAFLRRVCGDDEPLRERAAALIALEQKAAALLGTSIDRDATEVPTTVSDPGTAGRTIGHYETRHVIATGGMGTVYEAVQERPHRLVALKVLRRGMASRQAMKRFEHEAEVLGRLHHPNIAQIYDAGTFDEGDGPQPYFAMELVRGRSLIEHCESSRLGTRERLALFVKICNAVQCAHHHGVIHRDLKPDNVVVDDSGEPKVLDFGVARTTDSDIRATTLRTDIGQLIGTVPYMSPEQVTGDLHALDTRSDVYSLGVVLYELMCGHLPHDLHGRTIPEAVRAIQEEEPRPLSSFDRIFRGDIETIVARALEKEKGRRYQTATQLAADVCHYLADEPIVARPASTLYQLRKFVRRNRPLAAGVVVAFAALSIGTAAATWQAVRAHGEASRAESAAGRALAALSREEDARLEAEAVTGWLEGMLAAASPSEQGPDVKVRTILDDASKTIGSQFADQPVVEARLRQTMSKAYAGLGLFLQAEPHARRALEIRRSALGDEHEDTLSSLIALADLCEQQGRYDDAELFAADALETCRRVLGEAHPVTLSAMGSLGWAYTRQTRFTKAEPLLEEAAALSRRTFGETPETMEAVHALGVLYVYEGRYRPERYEKGEELYLEALNIGRRLFGDRDPRVLVYLSNLAILYRTVGRLEEAEDAATRVIELKKEALGPGHPETLTSASNLAEIYRLQGQYAKAERAYLEMLSIMERKMGPNHAKTLIAQHRLGLVYEDQDRYRDAEQLYLHVLEVGRDELGPMHRVTQVALGSLADLYEYVSEGREREAEALLREALEAARHWLQTEPGEFEAVKLNDIVWRLVRHDGFGAESYELALGAMTQATALSPSDLNLANTLGVAQYRASRYEDSLATLTECDQQRVSLAAPREPADWAFIAMAYHQLGHGDEARSALRVLRELMQDPANAASPEFRIFLGEAEALIARGGAAVPGS